MLRLKAEHRALRPRIWLQRRCMDPAFDRNALRALEGDVADDMRGMCWWVRARLGY